MRSLLLLLILGINLGYANEPREPSPLIVIGFPLSAKFSDKTCHEFLPVAKAGAMNVCMDEVLEIEFEVDSVLYGSYSAKTVKVYDFKHSGGFPEYLTEPSIYMVLIKRKGSYLLSDFAKLRDVGEAEWVCGGNLELYFSSDKTDFPEYKKSVEGNCQKGIDLDVLTNYLKSQEK